TTCQRTFAGLKKGSRVQGTGRSFGVGQVQIDQVKAFLCIGQELRAVFHLNLYTPVIKRPLVNGLQVLAGHLDHFPLQLNQRDSLQAGVLQQLFQGSTIPTAHNQGTAWIRVSHSGRVNQTFVVEELFGLGSHHATVQAQGLTQGFGTQQLQTLKSSLALQQALGEAKAVQCILIQVFRQQDRKSVV